MDRAVGSHGQSGPQHACRFFASHGKNDHFAAMLLFETQRLFEGIVVGFTGDECEVLIFDPRFRIR